MILYFAVEILLFGSSLSCSPIINFLLGRLLPTGRRAKMLGRIGSLE